MRKFKKVYIEITNVCNLSCNFCPKTKRKYKFMNREEFNYILNEVKEQKSSSIILKNTKEEIAALLGVPRPSLSRELINLRDMNYIEFNRKVIKVLDIEGLEEELFM